jgi:hypothetical protein
VTVPEAALVLVGEPGRSGSVGDDEQPASRKEDTGAGRKTQCNG